MLTRHLFIAAALTLGVIPTANAWFVVFPIPNIAKPSALRTLIDRYSQSKQTKALAYVYERRRFGNRGFVWGAYEGAGTQAEANATALARCNTALEQANGKNLYDFDGRSCELHAFDGKEDPQTPMAVEPAAEPASAAARSEAFDLGPNASSVASTPASSPPLEKTSEVPIATPANSAPMKPAAPVMESKPVNAQTGQEGSATRRLRELNEMRKEGLISQKDYDEKKKAILRDL
ncbi:SHOCT domain-containing protein [Piscinibacter gummiphilus]|uniref:SHOCT domain-containing protein n=1 Tax=Piscinibacter gummiphilus TaxID=946333 RepID=A0ABZ0CVL6_9BURK|nr:SHOCT domain-containing protein [Piscinibacter gummiphilus]WOB06913.1 SHOCT domain-containing protein [Piscinibacter gummiphilus]